MCRSQPAEAPMIPIHHINGQAPQGKVGNLLCHQSTHYSFKVYEKKTRKTSTCEICAMLFCAVAWRGVACRGRTGYYRPCKTLVLAVMDCSDLNILFGCWNYFLNQANIRFQCDLVTHTHTARCATGGHGFIYNLQWKPTSL